MGHLYFLYVRTRRRNAPQGESASGIDSLSPLPSFPQEGFRHLRGRKIYFVQVGFKSVREGRGRPKEEAKSGRKSFEARRKSPGRKPLLDLRPPSAAAAHAASSRGAPSSAARSRAATPPAAARARERSPSGRRPQETAQSTSPGAARSRTETGGIGAARMNF
jgi:hypothetical protein